MADVQVKSIEGNHKVMVKVHNESHWDGMKLKGLIEKNEFKITEGTQRDTLLQLRHKDAYTHDKTLLFLLEQQKYV